MKEDGTVNRAALPAIVNPEDLNALELALQLKEDHGGTVTALTMGGPSAANELRQCLYRGADRAVLLTDKRLGASDTLATSYALSMAVRRLGRPDLVFCGRQAIDGDTAQIGPQLAEKLGLPQFTYVEEILEIGPHSIVVRRALEGGYEVLRGPLPALLTVTASANQPRPPSAKRLMKCKKARAAWELGDKPDPEALQVLRERGLIIEQWDAEDAGCDLARIGGKGSPTRVKKIDAVRLVPGERRQIEPTAEGLDALIAELIEEHTFD
ncbi:MAG: electron transfer flavoprotein subunit beta/FixA family protein [Candidatus Brocadiae bacterium]|nr:electron transfer flavoprotein subunit beta/FixA family protein [Candidatus Brocadiia bacterium]